MIRNIFLPEVIGDSYYVFTQFIAACEINRGLVRIVLVNAYRNKRTVEQVVEVAISEEAERPEIERVREALVQALSTIKRFDEFFVVLPTNLVFFKELTFPFANKEKIKLILPFEVEPLLPFSLAEATVDGIITKVEGETATVLAVAVRNDILAEQLSIFQDIGIEPTKVTVDMVELYALYKALKLDATAANALLFYMGPYTSRFGVIIDQELKATRLLNQGLAKLARAYGSDFDQFTHSRIEQQGIPAAVTSFFNEIRFTLQAFNSYIPTDKRFETIFLMGAAVDVGGLPNLIESITGIPCYIVGSSLILHSGIALAKGNHGIPNRAIISLSAALALSQSADFNLYVGHELALQDKLINRQLIAAIVLVLLIIGAVMMNGFMTSRRLNQSIKVSEQEAVAKLKKAFPAIAARVKSNSLDAVVKSARGEVDRERAIWFALSTQNRASFLYYLQELSTRLDRDGLGLILSRLTLTEDTLMLEGQVRDYEALKQLEEDLRRSQLFTSVPRLQELKFSVKLTLDKKVSEKP